MVVTLAGYLADSINTEAHNSFLSGVGRGGGCYFVGAILFFFRGREGRVTFKVVRYYYRN